MMVPKPDRTVPNAAVMGQFSQAICDFCWCKAELVFETTILSMTTSVVGQAPF